MQLWLRIKKIFSMYVNYLKYIFSYQLMMFISPMLTTKKQAEELMLPKGNLIL